MRVDLITGFLGAGKTTFLKKYAAYLKERGERFRIIENEFCGWGVDTKLLRDTHDEIDDLSGYCMCCTGKDKFIAMLIHAGSEGYDRVLVEPSGIYDVDEFFSVMRNGAVAKVCEIGSVISILDAAVPSDTSMESDYLMLTQLLAAGAIVVSKTQLHPQTAAGTALSFIGRHLGPYLKEDENPMIVCRDWGTFTAEDFRAFDECGYHQVSHERKSLNHAGLYGTYMNMTVCSNAEDLEKRIRQAMEDPSCGHVLRVKGFARDGSGAWYEVNCTREIMQIHPASIRRGLLIAIGQELNETALKRYL